MNKKVEITLLKHHRELLMGEVEPYILDSEIQKTISIAISKNGKYHIYLSPDDINELIGNVCFVANHEDGNNDLILELDDLIDHLECTLDECQ